MPTARTNGTGTPVWCVGLDTASNRFHTIGPDKGEALKFETTDKSADVRRLELYAAAIPFWKLLDKRARSAKRAVHVFAEEPLALKNGKTTITLALAAGAIWCGHVGNRAIWWHWVNVAHWKKEMLGNGNASKDDIRAYVGTQGYTFEDEDHCDAFVIRQYGGRKLAELGFEVVTS